MPTANTAPADAGRIPLPVTLDVIDVRFRDRDYRFPAALDSRPYSAAGSTPLISQVATESSSHSTQHHAESHSTTRSGIPWLGVFILLAVCAIVGFAFWIVKGDEFKTGWNKFVQGTFFASPAVTPPTATTAPLAPAAAAPATSPATPPTAAAAPATAATPAAKSPTIVVAPAAAPPMVIVLPAPPRRHVHTRTAPVVIPAEAASRLPSAQEIYSRVPHKTEYVCAPCMDGYSQDEDTCRCTPRGRM